MFNRRVHTPSLLLNKSYTELNIKQKGVMMKNIRIEDVRFHTSPSAMLRIKTTMAIAPNIRVRLNQTSRTTRRTFEFVAKVNNSRLVRTIGEVGEISLSKVVSERNKMMKNIENMKNKSDISVFDYFQNNIGVIGSYNKIFPLLSPIYGKKVRNLTKFDFFSIMENLAKKDQRNSIEKLLVLASRLLKNAKLDDIIEVNFFDEVRAKSEEYLAKCSARGTYCWIETDSDLEKLLIFLKNFQFQNLKNMYKFAVITALRNENCANLHVSNLQNCKDFGPHLRFSNQNTKMKREEFLGLPVSVYEWLESLAKQSKSGYVFENTTTKLAYTQDWVTKQIRTFKPLNLRGMTAKRKYYTFHSLRKLISVYALQKSILSKYEIDAIQWHRGTSVDQSYFVSSNVQLTRNSIEKWLKFLDEFSQKAVGCDFLEI